jgi:hypothetical protein
MYAKMEGVTLISFENPLKLNEAIPFENCAGALGAIHLLSNPLINCFQSKATMHPVMSNIRKSLKN